MEKKYNFVYKTTNLINGKIYIGVHSTNNLDDGYVGSGYKLQEAVIKYKKQNFEREILEFFDNASDAYKLEKKLVTDEFVKSKNTYNIALGGKHPKNTTGMVVAKNISGEIIKLTKEAFDSDDTMVGVVYGTINVVDKKTKKRIRILKEEFDSNKHIKQNYNTVSTIKNGVRCRVSKEEFDSDDMLCGHTSGFVTVTDGNTFFQVSINDERYLNGELVPPSKNLVVAIDTKSGKRVTVSKKEFDENSDLVGNTYGQKQSKDFIKKRIEAMMKSEKWKNRKKLERIVCPHCGKDGIKSNMKRWHFDNCKFKK